MPDGEVAAQGSRHRGLKSDPKRTILGFLVSPLVGWGVFVLLLLFLFPDAPFSKSPRLRRTGRVVWFGAVAARSSSASTLA